MNKKILIALALVLLVGIPILGLIAGVSQRNVNKNVVFDSAGTLRQVEVSSPRGFSTAPDAQMFKYQGGSGPDIAISPDLPAGGGFTPGVDRTIIRTANLALQVDDTRATVSQINQLVTTENGVVTSSNVFESPQENGVVNAHMVLRVPSARLEATLEALKKLAVKVTTETVNAQDETEQKVDLDAQLANLRATEQQLTTIMSRATTVEETLQVQRELSNVRGQIERLQAQVENLVGDAEMATIMVQISTQESSLPVVNPGNRSVIDEIRVSVRDAIALYRDLFILGLRLAILALPLLIIASIVVFIARSRKSRIQPPQS